MVLLVALSGLSGCRSPGRSGVVAERHLTAERHFRNYTVRVYEREEDGFFEILRDGRRVHSATGFRFGIDGTPFVTRTNLPVPMGRSINGDHRPNLVVEEWTGGAHCCSVFHVFEIGSRFRRVATIDALDTEDAAFRDLRGDGTLQLVMRDWTFAYWNASFADSTAPEVILRYRDSQYGLDTELMRKPAPTRAELVAQAASLNSQFKFKTSKQPRGRDLWEAPPELWGAMLDLIYAGNPGSAWQLCDYAWPADGAGKAAFLSEFKAQLMASPYYQDLLRWNGSAMRSAH